MQGRAPAEVSHCGGATVSLLLTASRVSIFRLDACCRGDEKLFPEQCSQPITVIRPLPIPPGGDSRSRRHYTAPDHRVTIRGSTCASAVSVNTTGGAAKLRNENVRLCDALTQVNCAQANARHRIKLPITTCALDNHKPALCRVVMASAAAVGSTAPSTCHKDRHSV